MLITGAGPVGLSAIAAAQSRGAASVTGADQVLDTSVQTLPASSWDVVLECSGAGPAVAAALEAVRPAGVIVQVGMVSDDFSGPPLASLITKEVALGGSYRFQTEIDEAVALLAVRPQLSSVITHEFGLEEALQAFTTAADPQISGKVLVSPWAY